jgi:hypothetical protein
MSVKLNTFWQSYENGQPYKVIDVDPEGVVATTVIKRTMFGNDSFIWYSPVADFLKSFKPLTTQSST